MKIGTTVLNQGIMLAPMAGYTDRAMRVVARECGAEYTVTEMVSAKAVVYGDKKTLSLARILPDEGPVALQIFGSEPEVMAEGARRLLDEGLGVSPVAIDINMGCPVNKIFSNGDGSALMRSPRKIEAIVRAVTDAVSLPVTVKLRSGIDENSINAVDCALAAECGGASAVCIHGRTRVQMYGGAADRKIIENVKKSLQIPVIANGDILTGGDAISMLCDTGADGIAVGRGAVGNPFIFGEIAAALSGAPYSSPTLSERVRIALRQLSLAVEEKGEAVAVRESRKQIALYLRDFRGSALLRAEINRAESYSEVEDILRRAASDGENA
ncbi:MAG: tRNA dihydrouridine synthase DusB [Clostridia bacterium]|nr:tRNA dihydrouridine synthase DusB [Clostridia bacterium]